MGEGIEGAAWPSDFMSDRRKRDGRAWEATFGTSPRPQWHPHA